MRKLTILAVAAFAFTVATPAQATSVAVKCPKVVKGIAFYQKATWKWQDNLSQPRTKTSFNPKRVQSCEYANWVGKKWRKYAAKWRKAFIAHKKAQAALYEKWRCIHEHEGAWNANTGNGFYGGLQMDIGFQRTYGSEFLNRWGTANNWPVWAQLTAAERAYASRGFTPWPNTARACGLL